METPVIHSQNSSFVLITKQPQKGTIQNFSTVKPAGNVHSANYNPNLERGSAGIGEGDVLGHECARQFGLFGVLGLGRLRQVVVAGTRPLNIFVFRFKLGRKLTSRKFNSFPASPEIYPSGAVLTILEVCLLWFLIASHN